MTRQFWAYAVENGLLPDVRSFLNPIPHVSFVHGAANVDYLKRRHDALVDNPLFASMEFIDDDDEFARRLPLMAAKRDLRRAVALGWAQDGTDVDFGALSRQLIGYAAQRGMTTLFGHEVRDLRQQSDGSWTLTVVNRRTGEKRKLNAKFVFVGCGRWRAAAAAEVRDPGGQGLRRLPDRRRVPAYRQPGDDRCAPGQGVRPGRRRSRRPMAGRILTPG